MAQQEILKRYVGELLDASSSSDMRETISNVHIDSIVPYHLKDETAIIEAAYESSRRKRQVILAALGELICRQAVEQMTHYLDENETLLLPAEMEQATSDYEAYSPTAERFLKTMQFWFNTALREVILAGGMPTAGLLEIGDEVYVDYKASLELWREEGRTALPRAKDWLLHPNIIEFFVRDSLNVNYELIGGMLVGRGVAAGGDKSEFAREQVSNMTALSSTRLKVSIPIFDTHPLDTYSKWENGEITSDEFVAIAEDMPLAEPNGVFHKSLKEGKWKKPGHCSATLPFVRPDRFAVAPDMFLKRIGVDISDEIGMDHIVTATGIAVADSTLYAKWPKR